MQHPVIRLLGEPQLDDGARHVPVTGMPGRALVALADVRTGLTLDRLIDLVWSGEPPRTARSAIHVHLGTLRKAMASIGDGPSIESDSGRYRLVLHHWRVDTDDALAAVSVVERALYDGDPDRALAAVDAVLGEWRGPAMTVGGDVVVRAACEQLRLTRLTLEELRVDALVARGEHARAEQAAIELVDDEPLRERRWAQLLRARAAQGRTADALATYQQARSVLSSLLGLEPGDELVALEHAVLTGRPVLTEVSLATTPTSEDGAYDWFDPLPTPLTEIVGREAQIARVDDLLAAGVPVQLIGAPGAGKTRVAVAVAAGTTNMPVVWIDLRNPHRQRSSGREEEIIRWGRRHPAGLVVLDNAEREVDETADLVQRIRRAAPQLRLLITSRIPIVGTLPVPVEPLAVPVTDDPADVEASPAVRMLRTVLESVAPGEIPEPTVLADLCRRMGGLPLGIRMAADFGRSMSLQAIHLGTSPGLRDELDDAVTAVLDHLGQVDRSAFCSICLVAGQLDVGVIDALTGTSADHGGPLSRLVDHGLVTYDPAHPSAPYSIAEPIREVGEAMLDGRSRRAVLDRLADACLDMADSARRRELGGETLRSALQRQLPWHRQALDHLAGIDDDERALRLATSLELPLQALGWWEANGELLDRALAVAGQPSALRARALASRGRPGPFHLYDVDLNGAALTMAEQIGDETEMARALVHLGIAHWWRGDHDAAIAHHQRARSLAESARNPFLAGEAIRFLGMALVTAGREQEGFELQVGLLRRAERSESAAVRAIVPHLRMYLGHTRRHVGDLDAALVDLRQSLGESGALGNNTSSLHIAAGVAEVLVDLGKPDDALAVVGDALAVADLTQRPSWNSWLLCSMMRARRALGEEQLTFPAARAAVVAANQSWDGDLQRIGIELASVAVDHGDHVTAARVLGAIEALDWPITAPVRTLAELGRYEAAHRATADALGATFADAHAAGSASTLLEAASGLLADT